MKQKMFNYRVSSSKQFFLFFDFELVTRSVTFLFFNFELKKKFDLRVSNSKCSVIFYEVELVTRKKNFFKNFRVSNSNCDVILRNSLSLLDFVTREFRTSYNTSYYYSTIIITRITVPWSNLSFFSIIENWKLGML